MKKNNEDCLLYFINVCLALTELVATTIACRQNPTKKAVTKNRLKEIFTVAFVGFEDSLIFSSNSKIQEEIDRGISPMIKNLRRFKEEDNEKYLVEIFKNEETTKDSILKIINLCK